MRLLLQLKDDRRRLRVGQLVTLALKHELLAVVAAPGDIEAQFRLCADRALALALLAAVLLAVFLALTVALAALGNGLVDHAASGLALFQHAALAAARHTVLGRSTGFSAAALAVRAHDVLFQRKVRHTPVIQILERHIVRDHRVLRTPRPTRTAAAERKPAATEHGRCPQLALHT